MIRFCPSRFACIVRMLPDDLHVLAEIGYDHGEILLRAARKLPETKLIGVDKQEQAAARFARRHAHNEKATRIDLRCGDGLQPLADDELDTLLLAGLGERQMCVILGASPARLARVRQLFCMPLRRRGRLVPFLGEHGFAIAAEDTAIERGRYYPLTWFIRSGSPRGPRRAAERRRAPP